ncbi:wax ester/triacylglycerol synthase domain-containing protein [Mycobacterium sp. Aquia_213]|uniref:wax ester/triacylglycerol synthase domain-containing protein n=1 Tax=Mycobacterium sp. Aquia_213 TaxID=2991728 RepID=UPI00226D55EA|nr:wax ester/triacylglycerol synthase domain-containing protein [Mycobacterium sp. Aquia_213]WAC89239.1 WS/DGAT domain-containing protein [Mycobacterium sp. Aquia_213]
MSATDAFSLHTPAPAHTISLVILAASDRLTHQRLHQLVAASLPQLARFRSRLVTKPLGLGQPVWAEIDDYDPSPQIHCATVRAPGGRSEFAELIADLSTRRLDCREGLWEAWSINGLAGGQWALAVKTSPVLDDGAAGTVSLWPRLLASGPRAKPANRQPAEPSLGSAPSVGDLVADVLTEIVERNFTGMRLVADAVSGALQVGSRRLHRTPSRDRNIPAPSSTSGPVPRTAFNAPLTKRREVAFASVPLTAAEAVSNSFGGSITNVVLAACTLSLRAWLQQHGTVPADPLLMRMPFELPTTNIPKTRKAFTVGRFRIPVHLDDPVQVLANLHTATERLNAIRVSGTEGSWTTIDLAEITSLVPPAVARLGMQLYTRSGLRRQLAPISHGTVSYSVGDPAPAYCAGARVAGMHTVAPLTEGAGLSIALTSRGDVLDVSVSACPDHVPAVDDIATGIVHSVDLLVAAAQKSPRGQGRSVVSEMTSHAANHSRGKTY